MMRARLVVSPGRAALLAAVLILCVLPATVMNTLPGWLPLLFLLSLCALYLVYGQAVSQGEHAEA